MSTPKHAERAPKPLCNQNSENMVGSIRDEHLFDSPKTQITLTPMVFPYDTLRVKTYGKPRGSPMEDKTEIWLGTLSLMVLRTLETMGPQHGYGLARRIEQISGDRLSLNYGTLYPALLKLEQEGAISSEWGLSDNNRRAKFYSLTRAGRKQLQRETRDWQDATAILARFLSPAEEG
jgi:PadR family transcriptional regulator, regulatory protein PadR